MARPPPQARRPQGHGVIPGRNAVFLPPTTQFVRGSGRPPSGAQSRAPGGGPHRPLAVFAASSAHPGLADADGFRLLPHPDVPTATPSGWVLRAATPPARLLRSLTLPARHITGPIAPGSSAPAFSSSTAADARPGGRNPWDTHGCESSTSNGSWRSLIGTAVAAGAVYALHAFQYRRIAAALLWQARRAEEAGKIDRMKHYLERYLEFAPQDVGETAHLGQTLAGDHFAASLPARRQAFFLLNKVMTRDSGRRDVQRLRREDRPGDRRARAPPAATWRR